MDMNDVILDLGGIDSIKETLPIDATSAQLLSHLKNNCIGSDIPSLAQVQANIPVYQAKIAASNSATQSAQLEKAAIKQLKADVKTNAAFDALKTATFADINSFVNTNFASTNAQGRAFLKVLGAAAGAYLRDQE